MAWCTRSPFKVGATLCGRPKMLLWYSISGATFLYFREVFSSVFNPTFYVGFQIAPDIKHMNDYVLFSFLISSPHRSSGCVGISVGPYLVLPDRCIFHNR